MGSRAHFITFEFLSMLFEYPYRPMIAYYHHKKIYLLCVVPKEYHVLMMACSLQLWVIILYIVLL